MCYTTAVGTADTGGKFMQSYTIVDAHAHIFPEKIAKKATIDALVDLAMEN